MTTPNSKVVYFCDHCDFKNDRTKCSGVDQERYVDRNWCGWSYRGGVHLGFVSTAAISFNKRQFNRSELDKLDEAIALSKAGPGTRQQPANT